MRLAVVCPGQAYGPFPLYGDYSLHDPGTLIKDGTNYFIYGDGQGILCKTTTDLRNWTAASAVFPSNPPAWTTNEISGFTGYFWAPDIAYFNGQYNLYYACSVWGTINSAIGLVTSPSLTAPVWTDQGKVVESYYPANTNTDTVYYNCIDPSIMVDTIGTVWMSFGSYSAGILITQLDPATGKRLNTNSLTATLVSNNAPGGGWGSSEEGSCLYQRGGYYYLFVNFGGCCEGVDSTYNIRVGRSTSVTGPYYDKSGVCMTNGGGTMVLESTARFIGPGQAAIMNDNGTNWFTFHYYDGNENGVPEIGLMQLNWTADGWPALTNDWSAFYPLNTDAHENLGLYNGTLQNNAAITNDPSLGNVLSLDGVTNYVSLPNPVANCSTLACWTKWNGGAAWQRVFDFGADTTNYFFLTPLNSVSGVMRFAITTSGSGGEQVIDAPIALPTNQWCHVAVTLDGSQGLLYLNGNPVATNSSLTIRPWQTLASSNYIGKSQYAADPYFNGEIASFRIFGRALSGAEIHDLASAHPALAHRYSFTSNAWDSIGMAHGTLMGGATITNNALVLNGTTGTYVNLPGGLVSGSSAVTLECWATFGTNGNWARVVDFGNISGTSGQNYFGFSPHTDTGGQRMQLSASTTTTFGLAGTFDNRKLHVVCIVDPASNYAAVYTNGVLENATNASWPSFASVSSAWSFIGRSLWSADAYLNASIDELRLYDGRLTPQVIATDYQSGPNALNWSPPAPTGLVATAISTNQINLIWNAVTNVASYNVQRSTTNGGPYTVIATGVTATNYNDTGLAGATTYYYVVSGVIAGGEGANSEQASATTSALPAGWDDVDVGSPAFAGSAGYDSNAVWTVTGSGADIWNTSDQFNYCTNSLNGDGMIMAQVLAQSGSDPWAQSGIMFRDGMASNAPQVSLMITPGNGVSFRYRNSAGGATVQVNQTGISAPAWVRLSRSTNTFTASYSTSGTSWTQLGTPQTVSMNNSVLAGLAVTAHNNSLTNVATFNNVLLEAGPQVTPPSDLANEMTWQTTWPLPQLNVAGNALRPAMGWNSWFVVNGVPGPSEPLITSTATAMASNGLAAAGYKYVVIDGTWISTGRGYRDTNGNLIPSSSYWPDGMSYVSSFVHSNGLLMGGYTDIGALGYGITNSEIGSYAYYQQDADQFAAWDWDFVKIDDHGPGDFYAAANSMANNAANRPIVVSLSCPQTDAVKFGTRIANSYRVSQDISLNYSVGAVAWSDILREFNTDEADWYAQAPGRYNDPDMLMVGMQGISDLEGRTHFNMWCILGAPLMIGTDVRTSATNGSVCQPLSQATLSTLTNTEVIGVDQDPLCAVGTAVANSVYAKPLGSFVSGQFAVLLLNTSSQSNSLTVNWAELGLVPRSSASVRDLWAHQNLGEFTNSYTSPPLASHDSMMVIITGSFNWNAPRVYEAPSGCNTFSGNVYYVPHAPAFSATAYVTGVGMGTANTLQFNGVAALSNGLCEVDTTYACSVSRSAQLSVNGGVATTISFPSTGSDTGQTATVAAYVQLNAGANTLVFSNATSLAPNFDKLTVSTGEPWGLQTCAGDGFVNLSWTAPAGAASCNIYRSTVSGGEVGPPIATGLLAAAFTDTNVTDGQTYFYTVTAINSVLGGESPPSVEASAKPVYITTSTAYQSAMLAAAPAVWWRLDETNGALLLHDAIGSQNGTNAGAAVLGAAGPRPPDFLGFEMTNTAAQFANGTTNAWIDVPALNLNTNTVTITAWIYPVGATADYAGVCFYRSGGTVAGINYGGSVGANTGMIGYTWNNDQNTWGWSSGLTPPANQWSFVALVIQPASAIMYLVTTNGRQSATNTYAHPNQGFSGAGTIGTDAYDATGRAFNGLIDEVAVFNSALTPAQIQSLFANGSQLDSVQVGCQRAGANLNLTWPQGTLLQSSNLAGPWSRASASASPLVVSPTNNAMFYRVFLK
jgi:hypothetical protein